MFGCLLERQAKEKTFLCWDTHSLGFAQHVQYLVLGWTSALVAAVQTKEVGGYSRLFNINIIYIYIYSYIYIYVHVCSY